MNPFRIAYRAMAWVAGSPKAPGGFHLSSLAISSALYSYFEHKGDRVS